MATSALERITGRMSRPDQEQNQQDAVGDVSREGLSKRVAEAHRKGLRRKRYRDLTAEKYMLHIDGEGDAQWADILHGQRIAIPPNLSGMARVQHNLLRPMVDNAVAYHTTMPLRLTVETKADRAAREAALVDQALVNYLVQEEHWNGIFAEAMYLAAAYGHCPVHATWRDDLDGDPYEPVGLAEDPQQVLQMLAQELGVPPEQLRLPRRGMIDCWVGDPWDTVYNPGATASSLQWQSYGRVLPAPMVREAFSHVPGIEELEGNERMPSASRFQRTARSWVQEGLDIHGSSTIYSGEGGEELLALIYREVAPGADPEHPEGKLTVVALDGAASTDEGDGAARGGGYGNARLLHDGPLPGKTFSSTRVYSHHRFDDIHGKPYVADLDDLQVELNQYRTLFKEACRRAARPPMAAPSAMDQDTALWEDDAQLEVGPGAEFMPQFVEYPTGFLGALREAIEETEAALFRIGGWQAASRGEADAGDSGRKVIALARADDTIHGPTNQRFRRSVEQFAGICWRLFKEYGDVPWVVDVAGDEMAHLAESYVDRTQLSDKPPRFRVVSGFGATPEAKGEQLLNLVQATGADGEPLMRTREFRQKWPDQSTWPEDEDPQTVREKRPKVVNARMRKMALKVAEQIGVPEEIPVRHPGLQQLAFQLLQQVDRQFPVLMDDDVEAHLEQLATLTQDETEHPLVRALAVQRQSMYFQFLARQQQAQQEQEAAAQENGEGQPGGSRQVARGSQEARAAETAGTPTSDALAQASSGDTGRSVGLMR